VTDEHASLTEHADTRARLEMGTVPFSVSAPDGRRRSGEVVNVGVRPQSTTFGFTLVGWRHPKLDRGAIVTRLASGPLQDVGITEQYVVLGVAGRDATDAARFAKLVTDEHASLTEHGGTMRLKVQAADGAPRELASIVRRPRSRRPERPSRQGRHRRFEHRRRERVGHVCATNVAC
jgi:hypothetical protein